LLPAHGSPAMVIMKGGPFWVIVNVFMPLIGRGHPDSQNRTG